MGRDNKPRNRDLMGRETIHPRDKVMVRETVRLTGNLTAIGRGHPKTQNLTEGTTNSVTFARLTHISRANADGMLQLNRKGTESQSYKLVITALVLGTTPKPAKNKAAEIASENTTHPFVQTPAPRQIPSHINVTQGTQLQSGGNNTSLSVTPIDRLTVAGTAAQAGLPCVR